MIAEKIIQYNKAGGKVFPGLTRRREAERALFLTPMVSEKEPGGKMKMVNGHSTYQMIRK